MNMQKTGRMITEARKNKDMTQAGLANALGVSYQAVSNWERGLSFPDIENLMEIAEILDLELEELLGKKTSKRIERLENSEPLEVKDIVEIAPIAKPSQLKEQMEGRNLNFKDLVALAPFLPQESLDALAKEYEAEDMGSLVAIAPFLSDEVLSELALNAQIKGNAREVIQLAPFLTDTTIDKILEQTSISDPSMIVSLAPFVSDKTLTNLVEEMDPSEDFSTIMSLVPFLPGKSLKKMVGNLEHLESHQLMALAPFLEGEDLMELIRRGSFKKTITEPVMPTPETDIIEIPKLKGLRKNSKKSHFEMSPELKALLCQGLKPKKKKKDKK